MSRQEDQGSIQIDLTDITSSSNGEFPDDDTEDAKPAAAPSAPAVAAAATAPGADNDDDEGGSDDDDVDDEEEDGKNHAVSLWCQALAGELATCSFSVHPFFQLCYFNMTDIMT